MVKKLGGLGVTLVLVAATLWGRPIAGAAPVANCGGTSIGATPLSDLGVGLYQGFPGGLYLNGSNEPPAGHQALALAAAGRVQPLSSDGAPAEDGRMVLLSVGMSNTTQEYQAFLRLSRADRSLHRRLVLVDGAQGGQTAADIRRPDAPFWRVVDQRLRSAGVTAEQVQAIWLKEANRQPTDPFPGHARSLSDDLAAVVTVLQNRFPSLQLVFLSSRIYAGYASSNLNPEPFAYESGFSVRWLIERQLAGDPEVNADPALGPVVAPVLLWGPYLWADGLVPRSDGLTWRCEEFSADGTHPSRLGQDKVGEMLMRFFKEEETTRRWFLADPDAPTPTAGATDTTRPTSPSGTRTPAFPTSGAGATATPDPDATPVPLKSYKVRETPSRTTMWISTAVRTVQERIRFVSPRQPSWLCGSVVVDRSAEWGFQFAPAPMSLGRSAEAAWRSTIRAIAADPTGAASATHPVCILVDAVVDQADGPTPDPGAIATATPTLVGWRLSLPWAFRQR